MSTTVPSAPIRPQRIVAIVFIPFALGYFLSYLYRTVNAVIAEDLAVSIGVGAAGLGVLTSAYFVAFAAFQLPLGVLLDRFGPRRVEAVLLLIAAAGALVFALGTDIKTLVFGRALIGLGVSACLMAAFKANVQWWPKEKLPFVNGCCMAFGGMGALFATTPVVLLLQITDWRGVFLGLAAITVGVSLLIFFLVPDPQGPGTTTGTVGSQFRAAIRIFMTPVFWRIAPASIAVQATFLAYIGLWAGPWLADVEGLPQGRVAVTLQYTALMMVIGYVVIGAAAERLNRIGIRPLALSGVCMAACVAIELLLALRIGAPALVLWPLLAFLATASVLVYAILTQHFPPELSGRVNTALNMMVFVLAFVFQTAIGLVIGLFPTSDGVNFSPEGHRTALLALVALQTLSLVWLAGSVWGRRAGDTTER